ncbi:MAG: hypothetical protein QNJ64_09250 [Crocosphaera sp.]|nr:hypothetical protein [Crocosphaera sp.]
MLLDIVIKEQGRRYEFQIDEISHFTVNTEIKKVLNDEETELIVVSFFPIYELENLINIIFKPIFSALIIFDIGQFIAFFN